jgi:predicted transcriptional regulator
MEASVAHDLRFRTMSINLPIDLIARMRRLGHQEDFSSSSIVEQALVRFLGDLTDEELALRLRASGAGLRRA